MPDRHYCAVLQLAVSVGAGIRLLKLAVVKRLTVFAVPPLGVAVAPIVLEVVLEVDVALKMLVSDGDCVVEAGLEDSSNL